MSNKGTVLEVHPKTVDAWNVASSSNGPFVLNDFLVLVGRNKDPHTPLELLKDLSHTRIIELRLNMDGRRVNVDLPADMMDRLVGYLADVSYPFNSRFDCVSFVHKLLGEPYELGTGVDVDRFDMTGVADVDLLKPGDAIYFATGSRFSNQTAKHATVYIGNEIFLSKLGAWKISFQNIDQIRHAYGDCNMFRQVLKT